MIQHDINIEDYSDVPVIQNIKLVIIFSDMAEDSHLQRSIFTGIARRIWNLVNHGTCLHLKNM